MLVAHHLTQWFPAVVAAGMTAGAFGGVFGYHLLAREKLSDIT